MSMSHHWLCDLCDPSDSWSSVLSVCYALGHKAMVCAYGTDETEADPAKASKDCSQDIARYAGMCQGLQIEVKA